MVHGVNNLERFPPGEAASRQPARADTPEHGGRAQTHPRGGAASRRMRAGQGRLEGKRHPAPTRTTHDGSEPVAKLCGMQQTLRFFAVLLHPGSA